MATSKIGNSAEATFFYEASKKDGASYGEYKFKILDDARSDPDAGCDFRCDVFIGQELVVKNAFVEVKTSGRGASVDLTANEYRCARMNGGKYFLVLFKHNKTSRKKGGSFSETRVLRSVHGKAKKIAAYRVSIPQTRSELPLNKLLPPSLRLHDTGRHVHHAPGNPPSPTRPTALPVAH